MEGFLKIRLKPWLRRLLTRCIAIIPAAIVAGVISFVTTIMRGAPMLACLFKHV